MKILKRVITALLSAGIIFCAFFVDLFKFRASSNIVMYAAEEKLNAIEFFKMMQKYKGASTPEVLLSLKSNMIIFFSLFVIILLTALILIVLSTFLKERQYRISVLILSAIGMFSSVFMKIAFSAIEKAVEIGKITIGDLVGTGFINSFAKLDSFTLGLAPTLIMVLFAAIAISNAVFNTLNKKSK